MGGGFCTARRAGISAGRRHKLTTISGMFYGVFHTIPSVILPKNVDIVAGGHLCLAAAASKTGATADRQQLLGEVYNAILHVALAGQGVIVRAMNLVVIVIDT